MNNHQNAIFHQITNFLKTPLALLGVDLKNFQFNKICHFANHPYLCKGLLLYLKQGFVRIKTDTLDKNSRYLSTLVMYFCHAVSCLDKS
uniref:hypothetical protein n=1 Tax=Candidatus Thiodubiliella endoseptemdiera TaxID=2738886 RepID=UPI0034DF3975